MDFTWPVKALATCVLSPTALSVWMQVVVLPVLWDTNSRMEAVISNCKLRISIIISICQNFTISVSTDASIVTNMTFAWLALKDTHGISITTLACHVDKDAKDAKLCMTWNATLAIKGTDFSTIPAINVQTQTASTVILKLHNAVNVKKDTLKWMVNVNLVPPTVLIVMHQDLINVIKTAVWTVLQEWM